MTLEEILAALQAIIDGAMTDGQPRDLTDEEAKRYEDLETQLATVRRSAEIRSRQTAYNTPVPGGIIAPPKEETDTLERAYVAYLRTGVANQDITQLRAQGEGTSAAGGYLVPPGFRTKLVEVMKAYGGLAAEVDDFSTTTGNPLEYPTIDDTANQGNLTAESGQFTGGADMVFGSVPLGAYKYTAGGASDLPIRVSVELTQDAGFNVEALISRLMGVRIARKQAAHWCTGTGVSQPKGIVAASLTADETLDVSDTIDYDDVLDTEGALDPEYEQNAKWVMSKSSWTAIRAIVDGASRPLVMPSAQAGIGGKPEKRLLDYPVVIDQGMPTLTDTGAYFAVLGDLREAYVIRRVHKLAIVVNPYSRASYGEVEYTGWERADGNIQNRGAYKILRNV